MQEFRIEGVGSSNFGLREQPCKCGVVDSMYR